MKEQPRPDSFTKIAKGDNFQILKQGKEYFIITSGKGVQINEVTEIISNHRIEVNNFINIRNAITNKFNELLPFGVEKDKIIVNVSKDEMKAYVCFEMSDSEIQAIGDITSTVESILAENGIEYGINLERLKEMNRIPIFTNILVAEGLVPQNGENAKVKIFDVSQVKPKELDNGKVDHFDIGLINWINEGDWLGEWTLATDGEPGITVKGNSVRPHKGKQFKILYDKKTIREEQLGDKVVLYAKKNGAFKMDQFGVISVSNHLVLENVDYTTGNIDFDGYVTINGSVVDGFSIIASDDIEIKGPDGVGCVKEIISRNGNILITGGVNGKGKALIKGVNITSRYISNATVLCQKVLTVKSYIFNSIIESQEIMMDSSASQISGGEIRNCYKITTGVLGNTNELKTIIRMKEIDREQMKKDIIELNEKIEEKKAQIFKLEKMLGDRSLDENKREEFLSQKTEFLLTKFNLEKEYGNFKLALKMRGDSHIRVSKCIYPGVKVFPFSDNKTFYKCFGASQIFTVEGKIMIE